MVATATPYEKLYNNLKNRFTVVSDGTEYTVGDYMLMKASMAKANETTALTVASVEETKPIATVVLDYVTDKLTAKVPAKKDRTIKRFPLRTSFSAALSAVAACALVVSCGLFSLMGKGAVPYSAENDNSIVEYENQNTDKPAEQIEMR